MPWNEVLAALALSDLRFERELNVASRFTLRRLDPAFERIAIGRGRGQVEIRAVSDDRLLATLPPSTNLMAYDATWSSNSRFLTIKRVHDPMGYTNDLEVWNVDEARQVLLIKDVRSIARCFHPHKPHLLTGDTRGSVVLWDLEDRKEVSRATFEVIPDYLVYSPDGERVATSYQHAEGWGISVHNAADGGAVHLLDAFTGELRTLGIHKAEASTAVFTPEGDYLLTGGWEHELICWDMSTLQRAMTIALDSYVAQFRADGRTCALLTLNGIQLHAFEYPAAHRRFPENLGPRLRHAAFSPDGRWLAASADRRVGVWDLTRNAPAAIAETGADAQTLAPILFLPTGMFPLALSPDAGQLAVSVDAQRLQIWDLAAVRAHFTELGLDWAEP